VQETQVITDTTKATAKKLGCSFGVDKFAAEAITGATAVIIVVDSYTPD
jgi:hypothetical protein